MSLSVAIITKNEEANISRCLQSVRWANEIIILDTHSTDRTVQIAQEHGAKVHTAEWKGFGRAKQKAVDLTTGDWVLSLDADEVVTEPLADEMRKVMASSSDISGYYVKRRNLFLKKWISHGGWYPDYTLRLFKRGHGRFDDAIVHEGLHVTGKTAYLNGELRHYNYPTLALYLERSNRYTTLGAQKAYAAGVRANIFDLTIRPCLSFFSHYIIKQGFRDGLEGLLISTLSAVAVQTKYAKLRELQNHADTSRD
jgi:glycosyltransferase involved in cell wall biosynthesis